MLPHWCVSTLAMYFNMSPARHCSGTIILLPYNSYQVTATNFKIGHPQRNNWTLDSPQKGSVVRTTFPFNYIIMNYKIIAGSCIVVAMHRSCKQKVNHKYARLLGNRQLPPTLPSQTNPADPTLKIQVLYERI